MDRIATWLAALLAASGLSAGALAAAPPATAGAGVNVVTPAQGPAVAPSTAAQNASAPPSANVQVAEAVKRPIASAVPDDYVVGPGDSIQVFVWMNPELSANVAVRPDGRISTPLVEDRVVAARVADVVAGDYPRDRLEVVVGIDCDATFADDGYVRAIAATGGSLDAPWRVVCAAAAAGKSAALDAAVRAARGQVVVFTDSAQRFAPGAIRRLVTFLGDPRYGAVSGRLVTSHDGEKGNVLGAFWRYETLLRRLESRVHSIPAVTGAIYAHRRELWRTPPHGLICDDLARETEPERRASEASRAPEEEGGRQRLRDEVGPDERPRARVGPRQHEHRHGLCGLACELGRRAEAVSETAQHECHRDCARRGHEDAEAGDAQHVDELGNAVEAHEQRRGREQQRVQRCRHVHVQPRDRAYLVVVQPGPRYEPRGDARLGDDLHEHRVDPEIATMPYASGPSVRAT